MTSRRVIASYFLIAGLRRLGEPADVIAGDDCGAPHGPCAGQGLPDAGLVDATPRRADAAGREGA